MIVPITNALLSRQVNYRYNRNYCRSPWNRFGRWILAAVLIGFALVFIFLMLCIRTRRRRRAQVHAAPMTTQPHTGYDNSNMGYNNNPAPAYGQQQYAAPTGPPPNNGYYGQQNGISQPQNTYQQGYKG